MIDLLLLLLFLFLFLLFAVSMNIRHIRIKVVKAPEVCVCVCGVCMNSLFIVIAVVGVEVSSSIWVLLFSSEKKANQ